MIINSISLTNFRNHESFRLDFNPDTTLILGANGWGKTSILEAIYILMRGKSFRATDVDIIKNSSDFYRIELEYVSGETNIAVYDGKQKTFLVGDKKVRRLPKKNKYPVVLFLPSDLNLISGSPSRHREYFDRIFSELSDTYGETISKYEKALHQRNELLKSDHFNDASLFSWNLLLAKYGTLIKNFRTEYTNLINKELSPTYYSIAENDDIINLIYQTEIIAASESAYLAELERNTEKDHYLGHTSFGVHHDNFEFIFNNKPADGSASRGETRSIILALKFVESNIIYTKLHVKPIILLDDVFSELDQTRRKALINNFKDHQVIITSVEDVNR